jgi:hypothetical protein
MTDLEYVELAARRASNNLSSHDLSMALEVLAQELQRIIKERNTLEEQP